MKRKVSLAASVLLHAGVLLVPLANPAQSKMLELVAITFPENILTPAAASDETYSGIDHAAQPGAPANENPGPSADPQLSAPQVQESPAPGVQDGAVQPSAAPAPDPVVEAQTPAPATAASAAPVQAARPPAPFSDAAAPSRATPDGIDRASGPAQAGVDAGATSPQSTVAPTSSNGDGTGECRGALIAAIPSGGSGDGGAEGDHPGSRIGNGNGASGGSGGGGGGAASPAINHLAIFRAAVAKKIGMEAERRFNGRAVREDEGLVKVKVRVHQGGRVEIVAVEAEKPLLSDIIDDATRAVEAPPPPPEVALPVEISFRFRFVLE